MRRVVMQKLVLTKIGVLNGFFLKKNKVSGIYFLPVLATSAFRTESRGQKTWI